MLCCCCFGILGGILFIFLLVYGFLVSFLLLAFFSAVSFAAVCFGIVGWAPYFICCNSLPFSALLVLGTWNICSFKKKLAFSPFQNTLYEWASFYFRHRASKFVGTALNTIHMLGNALPNYHIGKVTSTKSSQKIHTYNTMGPTKGLNYSWLKFWFEFKIRNRLPLHVPLSIDLT